MDKRLLLLNEDAVEYLCRNWLASDKAINMGLCDPLLVMTHSLHRDDDIIGLTAKTTKGFCTMKFDVRFEDGGARLDNPQYGKIPSECDKEYMCDAAMVAHNCGSIMVERTPMDELFTKEQLFTINNIAHPYPSIAAYSVVKWGKNEGLQIDIVCGSELVAFDWWDGTCTVKGYGMRCGELCRIKKGDDYIYFDPSNMDGCEYIDNTIYLADNGVIKPWQLYLRYTTDDLYTYVLHGSFSLNLQY